MGIDRRYPYGAALSLAAMAHHRLGHADEARQAMAESTRLMGEAPQPGQQDLGIGEPEWQVWAVLLREAQGLINAGSSPAPPAPGSEAPGSQAAAAPAGDPDAEQIGKVQIGILEAELARLTGELKARPDDVDLARHRATLYAHLGRFRESLADHERALTLDPDHSDARFSAAVAALYLGDGEAYRNQARELMRRFTGRGDAGVKDRVAKTFLLNPPPDSEADLTTAGRLIDQAMELPHEDGVTPFLELTKALAEYRARRFESCLQWAERSQSHPVVWGGDRRKPAGTCLALAALAHHRLGRATEAARSLAESERLLAESPQPGQADLGDGPNNRLVWEIVLREARQTLGPAATADSR